MATDVKPQTLACVGCMHAVGVTDVEFRVRSSRIDPGYRDMGHRMTSSYAV